MTCQKSLIEQEEENIKNVSFFSTKKLTTFQERNLVA